MTWLRRLTLSGNQERRSLHTYCVFALIISGIAIRMFFYLKNPALWLDEATLSLNIINRDFVGLLKPLDTLQIAPIGFLLTIKFLTIIFGTSEYVLRLLPFITGISSIPLFYLLAKRLTNKHIALIGLAFFILGRSLIYYSLEVKQYGVDVFVYILCFLILQPRERFNQSYITSLLYGVLGGVTIWFSHIAILVLTAIGLWIVFIIIRNKSWNRVISFILMASVWAISFALNYYFFLHSHSHEALQQTAFGSFDFFPPIPVTSANISWYKEFFEGLFSYPLEIRFVSLAMIFSFFGFIILIWKKQFILLSLFTPLILNLILSIFHIYPCKDRLILYNSSAIIILLSYSIYHIFKLLPYNYLIVVPIIILLSLNPIRHIINGFPKEEIRKPMEFIGASYKENDLLYVQYGAWWAFEYYKDKYMPEGIEINKGEWIRSDPEVFNVTFEELIKYDRVWFLFSHYTDSEKEIIISKCDNEGKLIDEYEVKRCGAYLYSFRKTND